MSIKHPRSAKTDFEHGAVWKVILAQSLPLMTAQIVHLLYNIVDRVFIGHMPGNTGAAALTGIGLAFPLTTIIAAFTNLVASGGAPLFAIARGAKEEKRASQILNQAAMMLTVSSLILFVFCYLFRRPILFLFGASEASYPYADSYLKIYLLGTTFSMISTGMNSFINAQGFPRHGMITVLAGAVVNIILDPLFIYVFHMGVAGAALATIIAQGVSFVWVLYFFFSDLTMYRMEADLWRPEGSLIKEICSLGITGFIMQGTNSLVQIACNVTLRSFGGDLYVGVMTVINSIREVMSLPCNAITQGAQPVISFNYGARKYSRIKASVKFMTLAAIIYTLAAWAVVIFFPQALMRIFTDDAAMISAGTSALFIYSRICIHDLPVCRPVYIHRDALCAAGRILLPVSEGNHCRSAHLPSAAAWLWRKWRLSGRTDLQSDRRTCLLYHDVFHPVPETSGGRNPDGTGMMISGEYV